MFQQPISEINVPETQGDDGLVRHLGVYFRSNRAKTLAQASSAGFSPTATPRWQGLQRPRLMQSGETSSSSLTPSQRPSGQTQSTTGLEPGSPNSPSFSAGRDEPHFSRESRPQTRLRDRSTGGNFTRRPAPDPPPDMRNENSGVYLEYIPCAASDRDSISGINRPEVFYQILREPLLPIERC